jgi:hypothetical protein
LSISSLVLDKITLGRARISRLCHAHQNEFLAGTVAETAGLGEPAERQRVWRCGKVVPENAVSSHTEPRKTFGDIRQDQPGLEADAAGISAGPAVAGRIPCRRFSIPGEVCRNLLEGATKAGGELTPYDHAIPERLPLDEFEALLDLPSEPVFHH